MAILRSSQPLAGSNGKRCKEDERLVNAVLGIGRRGYILDTRSQALAKIALAKGIIHRLSLLVFKSGPQSSLAAVKHMSSCL